MDEMSNIDLNLKPEARQRSCTWPMKRPNICVRKSDNQKIETNVPKTLETTIEEPSFPDEFIPEDILSLKPPDDFLYPQSFSITDFGADLLDPQCDFSEMADCSNIVTPQPSISCDTQNDNLSFTKLETIPQGNAFPGCSYDTTLIAVKPEVAGSSFASKGLLSSDHTLASTVGTTATTSSTATTKPKTSSRKNPWGPSSYADLITQAIESSLDKRLTLAQIYEWMVKNIDFFKDKGENNSSAGWKNSIRHNLSLHNKFNRVQNEGTGKSSWWVINYDAKPQKSGRSRTASCGTTNRLRRAKENAVNKRNEIKRKATAKKDPANWVRSVNSSDATGEAGRSANQAFMSDIRQRTSSNASSLGGRSSPSPPILSQDLQDDGPPPLSPQSSSYKPGSSFDLLSRSDNFVVNDSVTASNELSEGLENMDILNPASPVAQQSNINDGTNAFINCAPGHQQTQVSAVVSNTDNPNLSSLLRESGREMATDAQLLASNGNILTNKRLTSVDPSSAVPRQRASTTPNMQHSKYNLSRLRNSLQQQQNGDDGLVQHTILFTTSNNNSNQLPQNSFVINHYEYDQQQPQLSQLRLQQVQVQQPQRVYAQQRQIDGNFYAQQQLNVSNQQNTPNMQDSTNLGNNSVPLQNYGQQLSQGLEQSSQLDQSGNNGSRIALETDSKYPADLNNLDNKDIFDPGNGEFYDEMDFNSYCSQEDFDLINVDDSMDVKMEASDPPPAYPWFSNLGGSVNVTQTNYAPSDRFNSSTTDNRNQFMAVLTTQRSGNVYTCGQNRVVISDNSLGNGQVVGLPAHFTRPHEVLRTSSSIGAGSDYRM